MTSERERFEAWALPILGDSPTWRESGPCELAWQAWQARAALPAPADQPRSQKMRAAGFTPRPTWKSLPKDDDDEGSPMTPSQEAREYPPLPEADAWPLGPAVPFFGPEKMRSYVDSDRKARQQEARAWVDVLAERRRQVEAEGWTPEHDDQHTDCSLARAAACYATGSMNGWPWRKEDFKDSGDGQYSENHRRMLVKAGALILAEIERLDRAAIAKGEQSHE